MILEPVIKVEKFSFKSKVISPFALTDCTLQFLSFNFLFNPSTTECIGSFVPVHRSPKKSSHNENPIHQVEDNESDEIL